MVCSTGMWRFGADFGDAFVLADLLGDEFKNFPPRCWFSCLEIKIPRLGPFLRQGKAALHLNLRTFSERAAELLARGRWILRQDLGG